MRNVRDKNDHNEYTVSIPLEETVTAKAKAASRKSERQFTLLSNMAGAKNTEINIEDINL